MLLLLFASLLSAEERMGPKFAWQRGFGGFSVSASNADAVVCCSAAWPFIAC